MSNNIKKIRVRFNNGSTTFSINTTIYDVEDDITLDIDLDKDAIKEIQEFLLNPEPRITVNKTETYLAARKMGYPYASAILARMNGTLFLQTFNLVTVDFNDFLIVLLENPNIITPEQKNEMLKRMKVNNPNDGNHKIDVEKRKEISFINDKEGFGSKAAKVLDQFGEANTTKEELQTYFRNKMDIITSYDKEIRDLHSKMDQLQKNDGDAPQKLQKIEKRILGIMENLHTMKQNLLEIKDVMIFDQPKVEINKQAQPPTTADDAYVIDVISRGDLGEFLRLLEKDWKINRKLEFAERVLQWQVKGAITLHIAALLGQFEIVRILVLLGADVNAKMNFNDTPLHCAVRQSNQEIVKFLLEKGADPNAQGSNNNTPLHIAFKLSNWEIVAFLLEFKADPRILNKDGFPPLDSRNQKYPK